MLSCLKFLCDPRLLLALVFGSALKSCYVDSVNLVKKPKPFVRANRFLQASLTFPRAHN